MTTFIGDYTCKVDEKGRVLLPSTFKKQLMPADQERFVVKKDIYEKCLVLYPLSEWERQNQIIRENTNPYNREHSQFLREFFKGTAEVALDANGRLLLPKRLLDLIACDKELVLAGQYGKIEIWSKEQYESLGANDDQFARMAQDILGNNPLKKS